MILDAKGERIIAQPHLLDDAVGRAPGFHFQAVAESLDRLVMGAVHFVEAMCRLRIRQPRRWLRRQSTRCAPQSRDACRKMVETIFRLSPAARWQDLAYSRSDGFPAVMVKPTAGKPSFLGFASPIHFRTKCNPSHLVA